MADTAIDRFRFHFRRVLFEQNRKASEVARLAGLSPSWASSLSKGAGVSLTAADAIAAVLGIDVGELFGVQTYHHAVAVIPEPPPPADPWQVLLDSNPDLKAALVNALMNRTLAPARPSAPLIVPPPSSVVPPSASVRPFRPAHVRRAKSTPKSKGKKR